MTDKLVGRHIKVNGIVYGPTNELGVVLLFGHLAAQLGFDVEHVQTRFPDCIARRHGKSCKIEFEYRASSYESHPPRGADIVVCWENDWERRGAKYKHLEIIDLKKLLGVPPRVFYVGWRESNGGHYLDEHNEIWWKLPSMAQVGDLVLVYRTNPVFGIYDMWRVVGPWKLWDKQYGVETKLELVTRLKHPLKYYDLKSDPQTRELSVVRKHFQGKGDLTNDWPLLSQHILKLNPKARMALRPYLPR